MSSPRFDSKPRINAGGMGMGSRTHSRTGSFHEPDSPTSQRSVLITAGECFTVQASQESLRKHLTDSYWCNSMEDICDGKSVGVAVRYTGEDLVMLQFRPDKFSTAGYRYPISMSIPIQYLVPVKLRRANSEFGAVPTPLSPVAPANVLTPTASPFITDGKNGNFLGSASSNPTVASETPHLCVVCGRFEAPGEVRKHGFKCNTCVGQKSVPRLREESDRLQRDDMTTFKSQTMKLY